MIEPLRIIPTKVKYLLLVLILPPDSTRASSNMAYLVTRNVVTTYRHRTTGVLFPNNFQNAPEGKQASSRSISQSARDAKLRPQWTAIRCADRGAKRRC